MDGETWQNHKIHVQRSKFAVKSWSVCSLRCQNKQPKIRFNQHDMNLTETTCFTLPLQQGKDVSFTDRSLAIITSLANSTFTFLTMLRLLASIKVTRTYASIRDRIRNLGNVSSVAGSSQNLLNDSVLDFVLLYEDEQPSSQIEN